MDEPAKTRSGFITTLAWILVVLSGYHGARSVYDNLALSVMFSSSGFRLGMAGTSLPVVMPLLARLLAEHIRLVFFFDLLFSLAVFVSSIGLLARKPWGLRIFTWFFYGGSLLCLIIVCLPGLVIPSPYIYQGIAVAPAFNEAVGRARLALQVLAAGIGALLLWLARKIESPGIQKEFGVQSLNI